MKRIQGYLLNRETGEGISGKDVFFEALDGSPISSSSTYWQDTHGDATDADGYFQGDFELSPGPIVTRIDVDSGLETKVRQWNEMAPFGGGPWGSDLRLLARAAGVGVIDGYLNELLVSIPSGHTVRVATGAAVFNGNVFSLENGYYEVTGSANPSGPANPRVDLVYLKQWNDTATGQNAGKQEIVILEGSSSNVAPATPTHADWMALPLAHINTAQGASTKTVSADLRSWSNPDSSSKSTVYTGPGHFGSTVGMSINGPYQNLGTLTVTGLKPGVVYDGDIQVYGSYSIFPASGVISDGYIAMATGGIAQVPIGYNGHVLSGYRAANSEHTSSFYVDLPVIGVTGVTSLSFTMSLQNVSGNTGVVTGYYRYPTMMIRLKPR